MTYSAKVIADSISPDGVRLTTMEVVFPRIVLAEFNTHRMFSRNSASSRAIPVEKRIAQILENPFVPEAFAANQKGMVAGEALSEEAQTMARLAWMLACDDAVKRAQQLVAVKVHKQWANRIIEPYTWQTCVVTATEWENFNHLRDSEEAQPEIRRTCQLMKVARAESTPILKKAGEWHLPYVLDCGGSPEDAELSMQDQIRVSAARSARVSYLTQDGRRSPDADFELHDKLRGNGHMSPLEHPAQVMEATTTEFIGNFRAPWLQYRKMITGESVFQGGAC